MDNVLNDNLNLMLKTAFYLASFCGLVLWLRYLESDKIGLLRCNLSTIIVLKFIISAVSVNIPINVEVPK